MLIDGDDGHFVFFPNIMSQCPFLLMSPSTLLSVFSAESARCQLNRWGFSRLWHLLGCATSSKITLPSQQQHPAKCGALSLLLRVFHRSKIHHLYHQLQPIYPHQTDNPPYCLPGIVFFIFYPPSYHHHHYHSLSLFHVYLTQVYECLSPPFQTDEGSVGVDVVGQY